MDNEELVYNVHGDLTLRHRDGHYSGSELVLTDARLSYGGRKMRTIVLRLTADQWKVLARLIPEQERRRYILDTAEAEMTEFREKQQEAAEEFKLDLIHKLGLEDWPKEDLPWCLRI